MRFAALYFLLGSLAPAAPGVEQQWPQFRGPRGDGTSLARNVPISWSETSNLAWKIKVQGRRRSSPVVLLQSYLDANTALDHHFAVLNLAAFQNLCLHGGFILAEIRLTSDFLLDPLGRPATAQTIVRGNRFHILLRNDLDAAELSISLYHEVLEAATVAAEHPTR